MLSAKELLHQTITVLKHNPGQSIEQFAGCKSSPSHLPDCGNREIKSRRIDAHTPTITLGGMTGTKEQTIEQVFNKIINVSFCVYRESIDKYSLTIVKTFELESLNYDKFLNTSKYFEIRKGILYIKITPRKFINMYSGIQVFE